MIDIINFHYNGNNTFGFTNFYTFKDFKIVIGGDDIKNRSAVENKNIDILLSPERGRIKSSGLNQVLCKLAKKNDIALGFNFHDVLISKNRSLILEKMMQNIRLCRKYKVRMVVISGAYNEHELKPARDLISFALILGMTPGEAKLALNFTKRKS